MGLRHLLWCAPRRQALLFKMLYPKLNNAFSGGGGGADFLASLSGDRKFQSKDLLHVSQLCHIYTSGKIVDYPGFSYIY